MRILKRDPFLKIGNDMVVDYPVPSNISYLWNFGSLAGLFLGIQLLTGVILAMHYTPHIDLAFSSVEHICRDVDGGWFLRYAHANGATFFFLMMYLHVFRGIYYGSYAYPRQLGWYIGSAIFILGMGSGFIGYVLPWGQMSLWGATVVTSLASVVPVIGDDLVVWLWGGFSVANPTLNRFFSLHYILPFVVTALVVLHLMAIHNVKTGNPLGLNSKVDFIPFHPYFTTKDIFGMLVALIAFIYLVCFEPTLLGEADNFSPANPMSTPAHIVPQWYFLPFYAILRAIPSKLIGAIAFLACPIIFAVLPLVNTSEIRSATFRPIFRKFFWLFVVDCVLLGWIGAYPVEQPFIFVSQALSLYYVGFFFIIVPIVGVLENMLMRAHAGK